MAFCGTMVTRMTYTRFIKHWSRSNLVLECMVVTVIFFFFLKSSSSIGACDMRA